MIKTGITGQAGFIGSHLYNKLKLQKDKFFAIDFEDDFFDSESKLDRFVSECDVIVHLAALNRDIDSSNIYSTNINLVRRLIASLERTGSKANILFSSSTQEALNNPYGRSKKEGRLLFEEWAVKNNGKFTGLIIPNVFGPFGLPYYNSVVATFCYQLTHNEEPSIKVDNEIKLIYIDELIQKIINLILINTNQENTGAEKIEHTAEIKVSELLKRLNVFKQEYFIKGVIPDLKKEFDRNLFNTFRSFIDHKVYFPVKFKKHMDQRGAFVEIIRMSTGGQVSFSTTLPGIVRGNHFHTRKIERFAVIKGKALIKLRRIGSDEIIDFYLNGDEPAYVDMPVWYTHNIENIGDDELYTIFWINEFFDPDDPDTFYEKV